MMHKRAMDRREFLRRGAAGAAALAATPALLHAAPSGPAVAIVRDKTQKVLDGYKIDAALVRRLVDQAVMTVTGKDDAAKAWGSLVQPNERVAVKFNGLFRRATTHPEVIRAVTAGLVDSGVKPGNITVFDRSDKDMKTAGLAVNRDGPGVRIFGTGGNRTKESFKAGGVSSHLSRILTEADAVINLPIMKTHHRCGITGALKNHLGTVHNAGAYHKNFDWLCELNALPPIKDKTRLCLADAIYGQYDRGPGHDARTKWDFGGVVASTDPVALDAVLADIIRARRVEAGLSPYSHKTITYIQHGEAIGLGVADLQKIRRVEAAI